MSRFCLSCLKDLEAEGDYHPRCARELFGSSKTPSLSIELAQLHTLAQRMAGHTSLSGVQRKLGVVVEKQVLQVARGSHDFLLKPQQATYPDVPQNEHAVMKLAALCAIEVPACGLVRLSDQSLAFLIRRFDRTREGKRRQEDFCQLAHKVPGAKYDSSAEECVRILRNYASEPPVELRLLFRRLLFCWWTGNGDMHLKNFSLLEDAAGRFRLSPAYDLLSTRLVIPKDPMALPLNGKKDRLRRRDWLEFAKYSGLPESVALKEFARLGESLRDASALISRSFLPLEQQRHLRSLLDERAAALHSRSR